MIDQSTFGSTIDHSKDCDRKRPSDQISTVSGPRFVKLFRKSKRVCMYLLSLRVAIRYQMATAAAASSRICTVSVRQCWTKGKQTPCCTTAPHERTSHILSRTSPLRLLFALPQPNGFATCSEGATIKGAYCWRSRAESTTRRISRAWETFLIEQSRLYRQACEPARIA